MHTPRLDIAGAEPRLAAHGSVLTPQRRAILGLLAQRLDHPTASDVLEALTDEQPGTARATVYNTLSLFSELGLVQEVLGPRGQVRYDLNTEPHHHFFCRCCERLVDVAPDQVTVDVRGTLVGRVDQAVVLLRGVCESC